MPHNEDMHYQASFDSVAPPRLSSKILQVGAALLSGACLGLLAVSFPKVQDSSSAEFTSLVSGPTSLRHSPMTSIGQRAALASLPGGSWKDVALAAMQASEGCRRDFSVRANPQVQAAIAKMDSKSRAQLSRLDAVVQATRAKTVAKTRAKTTKGKAASEDGNEYGLPGVLPPLNWFDPAGFTTDIDKNKLLFYREAEIKHGRICMSASLGFLVAERFHPVFGGAIDVPSVAAGKDPRLLPFWAAIFLISGGVESQSFDRASYGTDGELADGVEAGDIGYDPLGLLPSDPEELEEIQNKEILNGRFAMISLTGMIVEELVTGEKLHSDFIFDNIR
jgi:hypothetical protein